MKKRKQAAKEPEPKIPETGNIASQIRMEYHVECSTCKALRQFVKEVEAIGYRQVTTAAIKAILAAGDPSAKGEQGQWVGNYKWEPSPVDPKEG